MIITRKMQLVVGLIDDGILPRVGKHLKKNNYLINLLQYNGFDGSYDFMLTQQTYDLFKQSNNINLDEKFTDKDMPIKMFVYNKNIAIVFVVFKDSKFVPYLAYGSKTKTPYRKISKALKLLEILAHTKLIDAKDKSPFEEVDD